VIVVRVFLKKTPEDAAAAKMSGRFGTGKKKKKTGKHKKKTKQRKKSTKSKK